MSYTTTCPQCGSCYDESSDEQANSPATAISALCDAVEGR